MECGEDTGVAFEPASGLGGQGQLDDKARGLVDRREHHDRHVGGCQFGPDDDGLMCTARKRP
jgi:hypothetical protein